MVGLVPLQLMVLLVTVLPRLTWPHDVKERQVQQPPLQPSDYPEDTSWPSQSQCAFAHLHPRRYAAYHLPPSVDHLVTSITIDGILDEKVWADVPWSEPFQDIQGPQFWSQPWFATKFKLRYDQQFLYVGAYLEETEVWANVSKRNEIIFHDNDFEVFVDPDGSTHNYKEFELNARNATWNLWLNRPYRDGGHENSTRVDPQYGFDMLNGAERLHYWTAEIALPLSELARHSKAQVPPAANSFWRINFSRVEWPVRVVYHKQSGKQHYEKKPGLKEENWVWSTQNAVDMHRPEWWGYLQFRPRDETPPPLMDDQRTMEDSVPFDPEWGVRYVSFQYYYAQHAYHKLSGSYTSSLEQLLPHFTSREALECMELFDTSVTNNSFSAQIGLREKAVDFDGIAQYVASIEDDGHIEVEKAGFASPIAVIE
ncbi:unnamed protein product [Phytophthora fragariaefolia]|uniref:Unnamed protein product n=1 Tax=Phytophthora fragariaefolia TaxID=1490495 RepID=A0A9W6WTS6_9STRA|nr:unnamed protein product [Phytophthora fragariaefolia]